MLTPDKSHHILLREIARRWQLSRVTDRNILWRAISLANKKRPAAGTRRRLPPVACAEGATGQSNNSAARKWFRPPPKRPRYGAFSTLRPSWKNVTMERSGNNRYLLRRSPSLRRRYVLLCTGDLICCHFSPIRYMAA